MASIASRPPAVSPSAASTSVSTSLAVPSVSTMPTSVNSTKDSDPPALRFTKTQVLFDTIDHTRGDSLTVTNVSLINFTKIERAREKQGRKFRFCDYDSNSQILIITLPTDLHKELHGRLYDEFIGQRGIRSATRLAQGHSGQSSKEGDSAGGPKPQQAANGAWPTLVIEAGFSQSLGKLRLAMWRWFSLSNYEVKIVLLAKFNSTIILLEKWEEEAQVRPGATTTRHSLQHLTPVLRQSITITQNTTTDLTSYNVTSSALVLSFRLLFLRDPGPGEGDFVFSVQELEEYARDVWALTLV
ncbi:hypothetical protein B0T14DRAFT_539685 [Immersiella caudata]|uniref:Uncharacterized protein n=1 Tax=Immersiella caudata TaxID=314043 RepID=A0AA39WER5_9PEZI|nr:hypothetical protein B0T14DRAFT_539685 [Immersiella caudata]